jgi:hypothetical protein
VRSNDREVSAVESGDLCDAESFGGGDDRGVDGAEWKVAVMSDEFGDAQPVRRRDRVGDQVARREVAEESDLGFGAELCAEQVRDLGDDECRHDVWAGMRLEQFEAGGVVTVIAIDVGVQRSGVNDQGDVLASSARISSMRSEMPSWPLAPAPAASKRRCARRVVSSHQRTTQHLRLDRWDGSHRTMAGRVLRRGRA